MSKSQNMSHSVSLASLSPREAVADALYRCVVGMDDNNPAMFESSFMKGKDTSFSINDKAVEGTDAITAYIYNKIMPLHTTHFITNIRVDLKDGADTAYMTASALAYHYKAEDAFKSEDKSYVTAGLYYIDLVKDDDDNLWKIKTFKVKLNWTNGQASVISG